MEELKEKLIEAKECIDDGFNDMAKCMIDEAINELEEFMKPKMCGGCKQSWKPNNQTFHKYFCEYLQIPIHGNFCCNKH